MEENRSEDPPDTMDEFAALARKRVYIETYGCSYNFGDTANLVEVLKHYGSTRVESPDDADAVIVNTCTVVGPTERRMLRRLSALQEKPLWVTGCMPLVQREAILSVCNPVIISPDAIREAYLRVRTVAPGGAGIVQIAQGCLGHCTYCITRRARGPLASFPKVEIRGKSSGVRQLGRIRDPADCTGCQRLWERYGNRSPGPSLNHQRSYGKLLHPDWYDEPGDPPPGP